MKPLALALLVAGCTADSSTDASEDTDSADSGTVDGATCDASGGRLHWVVDSIAFTRHQDGRSDGFDLDGDATTTGSSGGCGIADVDALDGTPGVDNAFGGLVPLLENTEFVAAEGLIQDTINSGQLLLLGELAGVEDLANDDCVQIGIRRAVGVPRLGTDGAFLRGQTLDLDTTFQDALLGDVAIVDGVVEGGPFTLDLPLTVLNATLELQMLGAYGRFRIDETGDMSGVFAGGVDVEALLAVVGNEGIDKTLLALLGPAARAAADLAPNEDGACTQLSLGLSFTATPVYVYEDVWDAE